MDTERVKKSVQSVIHQVCNSETRNKIEAIGITSLGDVIAPVDESGHSLHNPIVDFDPRGKDECEELIAVFGADRIYETTGIPPTWMNSICKIMWIAKNHSSVLEKTWKFLCFEDLVMVWLGIEPAIDYSLASRTMAFDLQKKEWSQEILHLAGLDSSQFATTTPSGVIVGNVGQEEGKTHNLRPGTPIVSGAHDWVCASLGAGVISENEIAADVTGTMEGILIASDQPLFAHKARQAGYSNFCHAVPGKYMIMGFLSTAGAIFQWYRDNFAFKEQEEARLSQKEVYEVIIQNASRNENKLLVIPHFSGSGTPYFDPIQAGTIFGLTLDSTSREIVGGILEGLAFELRLNLDLFSEFGRPIEEIRVVGGGAKSNKWLQLKADITGRKVRTPSVVEASCKGAAMLAGYGIGKFSIEEGVNNWLQNWQEFIPNPNASSKYDKRYSQYTHLRTSIKSLYEDLGNQKLY
jgi:xylulokinase